MPPKPYVPTGLAEVDRVDGIVAPTLQDYVTAASDYVVNRSGVGNEQAKAAQIRLSRALARFLANDLNRHVPGLGAAAGEIKIAGGLRTMNSDVTAVHPLDGVRLAVEIKPVNLAVGRAIWSRFGDIRAFGVNVHLKFPFALVGGVLAIPTFEEGKGGSQRPTAHLIERAVLRLHRAGNREKESDAPHLLEGVWVLVYDPTTAQVEANVPPGGYGLRYEEFVDNLVKAYEARYVE